MIKDKKLKKPSFLISAGPTREYLDPVRFISNPSTAKTGIALAHAAARRGCRVTLCLGPVDKAYRAIDMHARYRLRRWLCRKHRVRDAGVSRYSLEYLHGKLGLARLITRKRNFPWAKA